MGFKTIFKGIWKIIWAVAFSILAILGVCMVLSSYGAGIPTDAFGQKESLVPLRSWGFIFTAIGFIFGICGLLKIFKGVIKFAFSAVGVLVFVYGVCACIQFYAHINLSDWFALPTDNAGWASIIMIVLGLLLGVIPFYKTVKKFLGKEEKPQANNQ